LREGGLSWLLDLHAALAPNARAMARKERLVRTYLYASILAGVALAGAACEEPGPQPKPGASGATSVAVAPSGAASVKLPPMPAAPPLPPAPAFLPEMKIPADNPLTPEKAHLGKQLFFDKRLSKDGSASCETCHVPEKGWGDGESLSKKVGGAMNTRHSPTMWNVGYNEKWYWDGRAETLEKQIEAAWKGQMGADPAAIATALAKVPGYVVQFKTIYGGDPTGDTIVKSLASFVRTIRSGDAPMDKQQKGDKAAAGEDAQRGWELFRDKAGCAACHAPPLYTDNLFHNTGVGFDKPEPDKGRGGHTKDAKEEGQFKTPSLRSVGTHPPYFHDGSAKTLDEAVDVMLAGGIKDKNPNHDTRLKKVTLTAKERADLMAFIKAIEVKADPYERPKLP
jgi:cytochrome c peroxidase